MSEQTDTSSIVELTMEFSADLYAQTAGPKELTRLRSVILPALMDLNGVRSCGFTVNTVVVTLDASLVSEDSVKDHIDTTIGYYASFRRYKLLPSHMTYTDTTTRRVA